MEYEFTQNWTQEDYVAFVTHHMMISVFKTTNLILFTVSITYLLITPFIYENFQFFFMGIAVFLFLIAFLIFTRYGAKRAYNKNVQLMTIRFRLNDEGITYLNEDGELLKPWNEFYSFKETSNYFFIYFNKNKGMLLAKRDFSEEINKFIINNVLKHVVDQRKVKLIEEKIQ